MTSLLPATPALRFCAECGHGFYPKRHDQTHCVAACNRAKHKRRILGGLKIYDAAMKWRIERPNGALSELGAIVDDLAHEERVLREKRQKVIAAIKKELAKRGRQSESTLAPEDLIPAPAN